MNCKNCHEPLHKQAKFCSNCGAKVIQNRITFKSMIIDLLINVFGYDSKFFFTLKSLIIRPEFPLREYVTGVRKKYLNPFTFFTIGAALTLLTYDQFSVSYMELSNRITEKQFEAYDLSKTESDHEAQTDSISAKSPEQIRKERIEGNMKFQKMLLKYFNVFSFAFLPFYALLSFLVYRKPYNYGEHMVINAYIQGVTFLFQTFTFFLAIWVLDELYYLFFLLTIIYYAYAYGRLYKQSFGKALLMILKFFLMLTLVTIVLFILIVILTIIYISILKFLGLPT